MLHFRYLHEILNWAKAKGAKTGTIPLIAQETNKIAVNIRHGNKFGSVVQPAKVRADG